MKKIYAFIIVTFFTISLFGQCLTNYLTNASFETPIQPGLGNNFPPPNNTFGGWSIPTATANVLTGGFNVIQVNGSTYSGGPNTGHDGNQYVDVNGAAGIVEQSFTLTCPTTNIEFGGWYSRRELGGAGFTNNIEILNSASIVVATSSSVSFTSNESEETWKQVTGVATSLPAGVYRFRFIMDDYANVDDAFLCATTGCILPVKLSAFSVKTSNCSATLNWTTTSESDLKMYEIQSSIDGNNYKTLGNIYPKNVSTTSNYSFLDASANAGKILYRLKMVDIDGKLNYSDILSTNASCDNATISVYPNPTSYILNINSNYKKTSTAYLYNTTGKLVATSTMQFGLNDINISQFSTGVYVLKIINDLGIQVFRVVKK